MPHCRRVRGRGWHSPLPRLITGRDDVCWSGAAGSARRLGALRPLGSGVSRQRELAEARRSSSSSAWVSGEFLAEQFMLIGIADSRTGKRYHICGGFPSASGKTNLAMMLAPDALGERYRVDFYGDDIAWLRVDPDDGKIYAINPEFGVFGVAKDTNETTNPTAVASVAPGTGTLFTNVACNDDTQKVWWEGRTPEPPADVSGWRDWACTLISERPAEDADAPWAHPNSRFTTTLANVPNIAPDFDDPKGVPIDAIIFGGPRERP